MQPVQLTRPFAALACALLIAACAPDAPPAASPAPAPAETDDATAEEPGDAVPDYIATGNEPFWSVRVTGESLVYSTPEDIDGQVLAPAIRGDGDGPLRYEGEADGESFVLVLHQEHCQDSMSGWHHDFRSEFTWGDRVLAGCARRGSDPVGELPPEQS